MIVLPPPVRQEIFNHAREGYPNEVCGVLVGKSDGITQTACREVVRAVRANNIEVVRRNDRYQLDPGDMARANRLAREQGLDIVGFYHSHPDHPAIASQTDLENSSPWGGYSYPIVSVIAGAVADLRCWYREGDAWVEETITPDEAGGVGHL
jgi:proteasome lid subunit RPN8/RPN11